jgi:hypothetical protein
MEPSELGESFNAFPLAAQPQSVQHKVKSRTTKNNWGLELIIFAPKQRDGHRGLNVTKTLKVVLFEIAFQLHQR